MKNDEHYATINEHLEALNKLTDYKGVGYSKNQKHYVSKTPIEVMQKIMTEEQFLGFCIGNAIKYLLRADYKGQHDSDMHKARQYSYWADLARHGEVIDPMEDVPDEYETDLFKGFM
jgi:hypothetical protein